jgi:peptidoglycan/LPS O-acetylase OafA/YrhL
VIVAKKEVVWFYNGLVAIISGLLVFVASYDKGYFTRPGVISKLMSYLGERSYSLYLTHIICILIVRETFVRFYGALPKYGETPYLLGIAAIMLMLLLSEASYRFVETPLREKGRRLASNLFKTTAAYPLKTE